jgi:hypothetical protein
VFSCSVALNCERLQLCRMRQSPAQIPLFDRTGHCRILSRSVRRSHLFYRNSLSVNLWTRRYLLHRARTTRRRIEPGGSFPPTTNYLTALILSPLFLTAVHRCSSNLVQSYVDELALAHKFGAKHKHSGPRVRRRAMNEKMRLLIAYDDSANTKPPLRFCLWNR